MHHLGSLSDRIGKLSGKSKLTAEASNLQLEADRFLAALGSCLTQQQKATHLVQTITHELSFLIQDVWMLNNTVAEMKSKLNKAEGKNAEQERKKEAEVRRTIQEFVGTVDKGMTSVMNQVDEISKLIDQAGQELKEVKVPNYVDLGYLWLEEVSMSAFMIETYTKDWEADI